MPTDCGPLMFSHFLVWDVCLQIKTCIDFHFSFSHIVSKLDADLLGIHSGGEREPIQAVGVSRHREGDLMVLLFGTKGIH